MSKAAHQSTSNRYKASQGKTRHHSSKGSVAGSRNHRSKQFIKSNILGIISTMIAVASASFTGISTLDQGAAYETQLQTDRNAASKALRFYANEVSYWMQTVKGNSVPRLVIENGSGAPIRNLSLNWAKYRPHCHGVITCINGEDYAINLDTVPPCTIETTNTGYAPMLSRISGLKMNLATLNDTSLWFTDQNGNSWARFYPSSRLVRIRENPQMPGTEAVSSAPSVTYKPATACS